MAITTALQVCNLGLSYLKIPAVDSITVLANPDKVVKEVCDLWYDPSRKEALRAHPWNFAKSQTELVKSATTPDFRFDSKFPLPTDFIRLRHIGEDNYGLVGIDFDIQEDQYLLTDAEISTSSEVDITAITKADPGVVTAAGHGFEDDEIVLIEDVVGMTSVNDIRFKVDDATTDTFSLSVEATGVDVDTSGYTAYASGGTVTKVDTLAIGYIKDITDVSDFDPLFVTYLALVFAKNICYGVTGKTTLRRDIREMLVETSNQARAINGQDKPPKRITRSRVIGARRQYSSGFGYTQDPRQMPIN